ncbi:maleylpyruvate isomerase family mycothiol-dependent enzyme [Mycobacterium koreense]|uniref:DinB family protein n=1 Tax=Mycolicibacillus koreensis TaxID=1069220 RepID=A0A7I7SFT0_9MYCO|nr:maleylpyruvate isomerase family mycothiol-dependent enzyme [Mycolicibacillus koreensis]MCV7250449.1 maleylpyruvate isomerase family mycothiol-dependent enzyme [Mycolicibacillus koreensis]OSC27786.1 DinB family protein [Mycolicibacillus koreensis]BBY55784.1 hypothetical protein MKOR_30350 [Mycolicibacillus koreensis]
MKLSVRDLAAAERADLAALLKSLTAEQWRVPSPCDGWTVRDVVAHMLSYDELGLTGLARRFARGHLHLDQANALGLADFADCTPRQLLDLLDRCITPRGLTRGFGSRIALLDAMVHHQDIRRPLGMPRDIPGKRLVPALNFARMAPPIGARQRIHGLRLVATDLDWAAGEGLDVMGPAEALLMAIAGRHGVAEELDGPGAATLRERTGP